MLWSAECPREWHVLQTASKTNDNIIGKHVENGMCGQSLAVGETGHYSTVYLSFGTLALHVGPLGLCKTKLGHPTLWICSTWGLPFHPNVHFSHEGQWKITYIHLQTHTHTHTHTHTRFTGTLYRRNGFFTVQTVCAIALHLTYT